MRTLSKCFAVALVPVLALAAASTVAQQPATGPQDIRIEHDLLGEKAVPAETSGGLHQSQYSKTRRKKRGAVLQGPLRSVQNRPPHCF
jgi:hypothetical protein